LPTPGWEALIYWRLLAVLPLPLLVAGAVLGWWVESERVRVVDERAVQCNRALQISLPMPGYLGPVSWLAVGVVIVGLVVALLLLMGRRGGAWALISVGYLVLGILVLGYVLLGHYSLVATMQPPDSGCGG
jgi:hypothetical protein